MNTELFSLVGKPAIVTGSTRGIGRAIAEESCRSGASCVISSEDPDSVKATTEELHASGYAVTGQTCDVRDTDALQNPVVDGGTSISDGS